MKKVLLIYPPFCTPVSPPYSITNIYSFLKKNTDDDFEVIDLNIRFHNIKFGKYKKYYINMLDDYEKGEYEKKTKEFIKITSNTYSENNKRVVNSKKPELFDELLEEIKQRKPDIAAFSIVYSSQSFYSYALIKELNKLGIKTVIGGPAVNKKLEGAADKSLKNGADLLEFINREAADPKKLNYDAVPDFSIYELKDYFTPAPVIPIKTSSTCYFQKCTFCTHHNKSRYFEFPLENIKKTIIESKQKYFFLIDDMIHKKRLLEIAKIMKELKVNWTCQLRPTKEFDLVTLKELYESGLKIIIWGVESGSDRILSLIRKGTNKKDIRNVLMDSHKAGIKNITYIIIGFPTETKKEFLETIDLLEKRKEDIDLISTSVFGLQKGTEIYENPGRFGIKNINEEKRTILEPKITYEVSFGLSNEEAYNLRRKYKKTIENMNKFPKTMNYFREHMLIIS